MRIGLYGGSFNPSHAGHRHVSLMALKRLGLDRVWWIVTPGNPLKDTGEAALLAERVAQARACAAHPRIDVTGFEEGIGVRYTVDTLRYLVRRCPEVRFVWIMGADNLAGFHRWRGWRAIAGLMPIAIIDRPGWTLTSVRSRAGTALGPARVPESQAAALADRPPPLPSRGRTSVGSRPGRGAAPRRRAHGRVWPEPRTRYLNEVSCSTPTGPRACMRPVAMPISAPKPNSPPSANWVEALWSTMAESTSAMKRSAAA